jgi:hypothetical protein
MNKLIRLTFASLNVMIASAHGDNLKPDVENLLISSAKATKTLPPDFNEKRMGEFTEFITKQMKLKLSDQEAGKLSSGSTLREPQEFDALLKDGKALGVSMAPFSSDPVFAVMADPTATPRSREAAYRLLELLVKSHKKDLARANMAFAKLLFIELMNNKNTEIKQIENYELWKFKSIDSKRKDWLYQASGFGNMAGKYGNGKLVLLAPEALSGEVIVGFADGSVRSIPISELEKEIPLPDALKRGNSNAAIQPAAPDPVSR